MSVPTETAGLYAEYYRTFGHAPPSMLLPSNQDDAAALLRRAIDTNDESVFDAQIPSDAVT